MNGGRGRCEKSPRKKCARDEAKQRGRLAGFGGGEEFTNDGKSSETTQLAISFFFFFLRPSDYRCLSLFFSHQQCCARACDARISCDIGSVAASRKPSEFAPPSVTPRGWRDDVYIFQDIGNILRDVARPRTDCANRHKYGLRVIERESGRWSNWRLKITFLSCLNFYMTILCATALIYIYMRFPLARYSLWCNMYYEFGQLFPKRILSNFSRARTTYIILFSSKKLDQEESRWFRDAPGKTSIWRDPLRSKIMSWNSSKTAVSYFSSTRAAAPCAFQKHLYFGRPLSHFRDRCKLEGFLLDVRDRKESRLCVTAPFPEFLSFYGFSIYDASVSPTISRRFRF